MVGLRDLWGSGERFRRKNGRFLPAKGSAAPSRTFCVSDRVSFLKEVP